MLTQDHEAPQAQMKLVMESQSGFKLYFADDNFVNPGFHVWDPEQKKHHYVWDSQNKRVPEQPKSEDT